MPNIQEYAGIKTHYLINVRESISKLKAIVNLASTHEIYTRHLATPYYIAGSSQSEKGHKFSLLDQESWLIFWQIAIDHRHKKQEIYFEL